MERRLQRVRGTRSGNSAKETPLVTRHGRREVRYRDSPIRGALRTAGAADAAAARRACRERQRAKERTVVQMLRGCSWRDSYCWMRATGHAGHDSTPQRGEDASPSQGAAFCTRAAVVETLAHRCRRVWPHALSVVYARPVSSSHRMPCQRRREKRPANALLSSRPAHFAPGWH